MCMAMMSVYGDHVCMVTMSVYGDHASVCLCCDFMMMMSVHGAIIPTRGVGVVEVCGSLLELADDLVELHS